MIFEQIYLGCLSQASYFIADEAAGLAAVVDPRRDIDVYLEAAARTRTRIAHTLLTHLHADFAAGHLELRARTGAEIGLCHRVRPGFPCQALRDGDSIVLGRVELRVLETPGHTPESVSFVVVDRARGERPYAALTGDTLFMGDVGRPDLMAASGWNARDRAGMLYDSLQTKLLPLPDETLVYPGHGAGSLCGKALSDQTVSTLGDQKRTNPMLQPMSRERFVDLLTSGQAAPPAYFGYDAIFNGREHATLEENLRSLRAFTADEVVARQRAGAQVLDGRSAAEFALRHLKGSLNAGLEGRFAQWAGALLDPSREILVVTPPGREREAALRLGRIGFDSVRGYLDGGIDALQGRPDRVDSFRRLSPAELAAALASSSAPLVVDVRQPAELLESRIEPSLNVPLTQLAGELARIPRGRPLALLCRSGYRSAAAVSLLRASGFRDLCDLEGGMLAWEKRAGCSG